MHFEPSFYKSTKFSNFQHNFHILEHHLGFSQAMLRLFVNFRGDAIILELRDPHFEEGPKNIEWKYSRLVGWGFQSVIARALNGLKAQSRATKQKVINLDQKDASVIQKANSHLKYVVKAVGSAPWTILCTWVHAGWPFVLMNSSALVIDSLRSLSSHCLPIQTYKLASLVSKMKQSVGSNMEASNGLWATLVTWRDPLLSDTR